MTELDLHQIPGHVAIVADGNGCTVGEAALVDVVEGALEVGLRWLTVDLVPSARWSEPIGELRALLADAERVLLARRDDLHARGVRVRAIGRRGERLPRRLRRRIDDTEALTAANHGMTLTLGVDYDGRAELTAAMAAIAEEVRDGARKVGGDRRRRARRPPRGPRPARPRPAGAHRGRDPHLQLPGLGDRLLRVRVHRRRSGPTSAAPTSSTPSPSSSAASAASAPSTPPEPEHPAQRVRRRQPSDGCSDRGGRITLV